MNKQDRMKIATRVEANHESYFNNIAHSPHHEMLKPRFASLRKTFRKLSRKEFGSINSIEMIPILARLMFGLNEDLGRLKLPKYGFDEEKDLINKYIIYDLELKRNSNYSDECASYGETLLNCYLDVFITLTVLNTEKKIGTKPSFLVNPVTGSNLEIDILFGDFRLGFEFQGEHHYTCSNTQAKDVFKLNELPRKNRILIPINISQLKSDVLQKVILNSIKDYLGIHAVFETLNFKSVSPNKTVSNGNLLRFSKVVQRIYLSKILFKQSLQYLDNEAQTYIQNAINRNVNSMSGRNPAPRFKDSGQDFDIIHLYKNLKYVTQMRKGSNQSLK